VNWHFSNGLISEKQMFFGLQNTDQKTTAGNNGTTHRAKAMDLKRLEILDVLSRERL